MRCVVCLLVIASVQFVRGQDGGSQNEHRGDEWQEMPQGNRDELQEMPQENQEWQEMPQGNQEWQEVPQGNKEWQEMPQGQHQEHEGNLDEWQEMPGANDAHDEPENHIDEIETTTEFVNPWTLMTDDRVFVDDDDYEEDITRPEWEAEEFRTTMAPWTRRTFNWTRRTWNWTTVSRTTRKMFTGRTYNSSHVLCTEAPYHLHDPTDVSNYIVVDKHDRYDTFIKYRTEQMENYRRRMNETEKESKSLEKEFSDGTSEGSISRGIDSYVRQHRLSQEIETYESIIHNFEKQIEACKNLIKIDEQRDEVRKQIHKKKEHYAKTTTANGTIGHNFIDYSEEFVHINFTYADLVRKTASLVDSFQFCNKKYDTMLTSLDQIKNKKYNKGDYRHTLIKLSQLNDRLKWEVNNDQIDSDTYSKRKDVIRNMEFEVQGEIAAVEYMDKMRQAKYKSNYWERQMQTNVTRLDHYIHDRHLNKTLETLAKKLRDLFQVRSLEYEDDCRKVNTSAFTEEHSNQTEGYTIFSKDDDATNEPKLNEQLIQTGINHTLKNTGEKYTNPIREHFDEHKNYTNYEDEPIVFTKTGENTRKNESNEEESRMFKYQEYDEELAEDHLEELRQLDKYVDIVHEKVNMTYTKFMNLWDRFGKSIRSADITDKSNYQNLVKIYGIPANFTMYRTPEKQNLTEELVMERIGHLLNKKVSFKKIKQIYQDWSTDYLRPPFVVEFYKYKDKMRYIKDYMNFILIQPRTAHDSPIFTKLKLKPRIIYLPWVEYSRTPLKYKYDRFIIRDELPPRMNKLIMRVKRKINETGMSKSSIVWHNNSRVFFRRHYHGHVRSVFYYDNLDNLFDESGERTLKEDTDEIPEYLRKKTTSFGKRWVMMKSKWTNFMRRPKKRTTKYLFWAVTRKKTTREKEVATFDKRALGKLHRIW